MLQQDPLLCSKDQESDSLEGHTLGNNRPTTAKPQRNYDQFNTDNSKFQVKRSLDFDPHKSLLRHPKPKSRMVSEKAKLWEWFHLHQQVMSHPAGIIRDHVGYRYFYPSCHFPYHWDGVRAKLLKEKSGLSWSPNINEVILTAVRRSQSGSDSYSYMMNRILGL
jgi:hypothetical protein